MQIFNETVGEHVVELRRAIYLAEARIGVQINDERLSSQLSIYPHYFHPIQGLQSKQMLSEGLITVEKWCDNSMEFRKQEEEEKAPRICCFCSKSRTRLLKFQ